MKFNIINAPSVNQDNYDKEIEEHYLTGRKYYLKPSKNDSVKAEGYNAGDFNGGNLFPEKFYLNTDLDPITGMIKQKSALSEYSLKSVLDQIELRKILLNRHLNEIDYTICKTDTALFELASFPVGMSPGADKRRGSLEGLVQGLEQEKRREELEAFRDLNMLHEKLHETMGDHLSTKRAEKMFGEMDDPKIN